MLEGRGEEKADTGPGWRALAPVSPGCHPSRSRLLIPPGSETSQNRTAGAGRPVQSRGWGLPRPPSGGSHRGAQGPVAVTRPWALPSTPSLEGKGPRLPQEPPEPRSRNCSAQLTPPPGARVPRTPPASGNPHGPVLPARPPGAPPALLGGEALHTPPPPRQDRHTLTHIIHTPAAMFRGWMVMQLKRPEIAQAVKRNTRARVGRGRPPGEMARDGTRSPSDPAPGSPHSSQTSPLRQLTQARPAHSSTDR